MGDVGDYWRDVGYAMREDSKQKRERNRESSKHMIEKSNIKFESKNNGAHLIVTAADGRIFDFWPGTGKFVLRGSSKYGRGVRNLMRRVSKPSK